MVKVTWSHAWRMHAIWNPKPCQESQYISFFCKIWIWNCIQTHFTGEQQPSINDTMLLTDDVDKEQVDAFDDISKHERKSQESDVGEDEKATDVSANSSSSVSSANKVSKDDTFWKFHKRGGHLYSFHVSRVFQLLFSWPVKLCGCKGKHTLLLRHSFKLHGYQHQSISGGDLST